MKRIKGKIYSEDLGINLKSGKESELFKWFLACLLFGKPIQQEVAKRTYFEFEKEELLAPQKILEAGWDKIVEVLDRGHYVRYDFSTATKLLEILKELKEGYGNLTNLLRSAKSEKDLLKKFQGFKGIGSVTTRIFLRDLKPNRYNVNENLINIAFFCRVTSVFWTANIWSKTAYFNCILNLKLFSIFSTKI